MNYFKRLLDSLSAKINIDNIVLTITIAIMLLTAFIVFFVKNVFIIAVAVVVAFITAMLSTNYIAPTHEYSNFFARLFAIKDKSNSFQRLTTIVTIFGFLLFLLGKYSSNEYVTIVATALFYFSLIAYYLISYLVISENVRKQNEPIFLTFWIIVPALALILLIAGKSTLLIYRCGLVVLLISLIFQLIFSHRQD